MERILLIKLSSLGDLFHAVPAAHLLKTHFGCSVDWVTQSEYVPIVRCHRDVDRVLPFPRHGSLSAWRCFRRNLREVHYDLVVDLQGLLKSGIICGMARETRAVGCSYPREGASLFWTDAPKAQNPTRHAVDRILDTLTHLEVPVSPIRYPLDFPTPTALPTERPVVALAPKSRWPGKDWPLDAFIELGRKLIEDHAANVWVIGGPEDRKACTSVSDALGTRAHNLCAAFPLLELGGALSQATLLICNDSGPMHFAAAVGTPVIALFGPTDPARTGPYGNIHQVLRPAPGPEGYPDHRSYKRVDNAFIAQIPVEDVLEAARRFF